MTEPNPDSNSADSDPTNRDPTNGDPANRDPTNGDPAASNREDGEQIATPIAKPSGLPTAGFELVDPVRRMGFLRRASIRWRYRHITNRRLWDLLVDFDTLIEANSWDLTENFDELNERYPD